MKKILFALMLLLSSVAVAQVPRTISYQGLLTDGSGNFIADGNHSLTIKLYESASGGTAVYEESQSVAIVKGLFNVMIGGVTPIPTSLAFDKAYYLGVSVDGGTELVPRSAISAAPYTMYASVAGMANSLAPAVTGVVTSVNEKSGAVTLQGGGGTTITSVGNVITVSSTGGGGTGIQGVQNSDGSLTIANPNGPTATISVADGGISAAKLGGNSVASANIVNGTIVNADLADGAVTNAKISSGAATIGQILTADGLGNSSWTTLVGGGALTLPFTGSISNVASAFVVTNTGAGGAIKGVRSAATGTAAAVLGETSSADGNAVAVQGTIVSTTPGGFSTAVKGVNNGTGGLGVGVSGSQAGSGWGVYGTAPSGIGVYGLSTSGFGVYGQSTSGASVYGIQPSSGTSSAGLFENTNTANSAVALASSTNGSGAGISSTATGTGKAGIFTINNASNSAIGLDVSTNGTGRAANFAISNSASTATTLWATNSGAASSTAVYGGNGGLGKGGFFEVSNSSNSSVALTANTQGTGIALAVSNVNASNSSSAMQSITVGTGKAGYFAVQNSSSTANALEATTNGTGTAVRGTQTGTSGNAAAFEITNSSNITSAVTGTTSGGGAGVFGYNTGTTGKGGTFRIANASSTGAALYGETNGTSSSSHGILGEHSATSGTGAGVYGKTASTSSNAIGVLGEVTPTSPGGSSAGLRGINNGVGSFGIGVWGSQDGDGWGVYGSVADAGVAIRGVASGAGTGGYFNAADGGNALIANMSGTTASTTTTDNIAIFQSAGVNKARIDRTGKGFFNGGTQASGADVAEAFAVVGDIANYEPGDVLVIASGYSRTVEKCSKAYATSVLGVHATKPGMLLTERDIDSDMTDLVPMGVVGVLPTKVTSQGGAIKAGDLLVTSSKMGYAMKGDPRKMKLGMVIGKALEDFDGKEGIINVFVNVK